MSCRDAVAFLEESLGDSLDTIAPSSETLRAHVEGCASCASVRDAIREGAALASRLYATDDAGDLALADAVRARLPSGRVLTLRRVAAAAAVLVAAAAGVTSAITLSGRGERPADVARAPAGAPPRGFVADYAGPRFEDVSATSGIVGVDHTGHADSKDWMVETVGHGAAAFDMDADGDLDLFVPDGNRLDLEHRVRDGWRLYRNDGAMRFTDVTAGSGLESDSWAGGAVAGDVNADGLPDLFVPCFGLDHLFLNRGGGKFEDATARAGVAGREEEWSTAAALGDFNGDGALDLFVTNYADMRGFMSQAGPRSCKWRGLAIPCGPQPLNPQQDRLYLNRGDGTFADATSTNLPRAARYSFQCLALDVNADGHTDVFVATDGHPKLLLLNDGRGHFENQALAAGVASDGAGRDTAGMGAAAGDMDGDGITDLFVTNFSHEPNTLYRGRGGRGIPTFTDVTTATGLHEDEALLGWGASFLDYDCDGHLDVMFANGHLYPDVAVEVPETSYAQPLSLYRNAGGGTFREVTASVGGALVEDRVHRGLVVADLDDDGRLDAFATVMNQRTVVLRNDGRGAGNALQLLLRRRDGRVEGAGAHVTVRVRGERRLARDVLLGSSFGSSEDPRVHFGLGAASRVEGIEVTWPGGAVERFPAADAGGLYEIVEGRADVRRIR